MPVYIYRCKKCGYTTKDIFRTVKEMDLLPVIESGEVTEPCTSEDRKHDWEKQLGNFSVRKGRGWGAKGHW